MLRRLIGDEAFFAGLKQYYQDWHYKKAGTDDLRQAFETATPIKLSRFFDRWILASDLPRIVVTTRPGASAQSLVVRIEQQGEVFDFPYTVSVQYADGRTEDITIPVTEQTTERTIELKGAVRRVDTKDELTLVTFAK
jgi:aminopeptidase N